MKTFAATALVLILLGAGALPGAARACDRSYEQVLSDVETLHLARFYPRMIDAVDAALACEWTTEQRENLQYLRARAEMANLPEVERVAWIENFSPPWTSSALTRELQLHFAESTRISPVFRASFVTLLELASDADHAEVAAKARRVIDRHPALAGAYAVSERIAAGEADEAVASFPAIQSHEDLIYVAHLGREFALAFPDHPAAPFMLLRSINAANFIADPPSLLENERLLKERYGDSPEAARVGNAKGDPDAKVVASALGTVQLAPRRAYSAEVAVFAGPFTRELRDHHMANYAVFRALPYMAVHGDRAGIEYLLRFTDPLLFPNVQEQRDWWLWAAAVVRGNIHSPPPERYLADLETLNAWETTLVNRLMEMSLAGQTDGYRTVLLALQRHSPPWSKVWTIAEAQLVSTEARAGRLDQAAKSLELMFYQLRHDTDRYNRYHLATLLIYWARSPRLRDHTTPRFWADAREYVEGSNTHQGQMLFEMRELFEALPRTPEEAQ